MDAKQREREPSAAEQFAQCGKCILESCNERHAKCRLREIMPDAWLRRFPVQSETEAKLGRRITAKDPNAERCKRYYERNRERILAQKRERRANAETTTGI
jgi:hypothetical protein